MWAIISGRKRANQNAPGEPVQVFGSNKVELAWTIIPTIIVIVLALVTVRVIRDVDLTEPPPGALRVQVIGHQWWWEYRYPDSGVVTANELMIPVGRPIWLEVESADVIHSWWVPRLAGKRDVIPGYPTAFWFSSDEQGTFLGQCAEYCGTMHAGMLLRVEAVSASAFDAWIGQQQATPAAPQSQLAQEGHLVFQALSCSNCHSIKGTSDGLFGPDLTHLASRKTIGSGIVQLDEATLRLWISDPQVLKPGCNMPSLNLDPKQLSALVAYLWELH